MNKKGFSLIVMMVVIGSLLLGGVVGYSFGKEKDESKKFENFNLYQPSDFIFGTTPRGQIMGSGCSGDYLKRYVEIISKVDSGSKGQLQLFGDGGAGQNAIILMTENHYKLDPFSFVNYMWGTNVDNAIALTPGCFNEYVKPLYAYPDKLLWQLYSCSVPIAELGFIPTKEDFIEYQQCRTIENQIRDYFDKKVWEFQVGETT